MAEIDHIVLGAASLEAGAAWLEQHLGVRPQPGGQHLGVGTHNMLLGLGPSCYLEVIAPDPSQPEPAHPRPFDLDDPAVRTMLEAEPRLLAWVARTPVLDAVVARLGPRAGGVKDLSRGDLHWRRGFPPQRQDRDTLIPALIEWRGNGASSRIRDSKCRLRALEGEHPEDQAARAALAERGLDEVLKLRRSPRARLLAHIQRPDGVEVTLSSG